MPEFHKNQIAWDSPASQGVKLAKPEYEQLAGAFNTLGRMADNVANSEMGYLDNQMTAQLNAVTAEVKEMIKNADSLDADYSFLEEQAMAKWNSVFGSFDEATQRRFLNNNPTAKEQFELGVRAQTLKKEQDQIYNRSKLDIAQWSTDVVTAPPEQQDAVLRDRIAAIQNLGLPITKTDELVFALRSEIDDYSIANAISNNDFERAKDLIENGLPTKGASARAQYYKQLQGAIKQASYEKAQEEKLLAEAKEQGSDLETASVLEAHQKLLEIGDLEGAKNLRESYYVGADIPLFDEDGNINNIMHASQTSGTLRDKIYAKMVTSAGRTPWKEEYGTQYMADFNRLSSGFMEKDGSLKLEDGATVSPEQYLLAKKLRKQEVGWESLQGSERVFVDNVLRSYGSEDGLYMIDLNPNAKMGYSRLGIDYTEKNPVINYNALRQEYSSPANIIAAAVKNPDNTSVADVMRYFTDEYKEKKFTGEYKIEHGTRPDALVNLFVDIATKNNPNGMSDAGLEGITRATLEDKLVEQIVSLKQNGLYEKETTYPSLVEDFNALYERTTGHKYVAPKDGDRMQTYITLAYQQATTNPSHKKSKAYDQSLVSEGLSKRKYEEEMSRQRAAALAELPGRVSFYTPPEVYTEEEPKSLPSFDGALTNYLLRGAK